MNFNEITAAHLVRRHREIGDSSSEHNNFTKHSLDEEDKQHLDTDVESQPVVAPTEMKSMLKIVDFVQFTEFLFLLYTEKIKCHCDICYDENFTCETDGLCFTSVELSDGKPSYSYR